MSKKRCPCCANLTIENEYDICPVCFWEHDLVQEEDDKSYAGANGETCLFLARLCYTLYGYSHQNWKPFVRKPTQKEAGI